MTSPVDRTLDACLNRASEGLRVLMDLVRFQFDDPQGSESLKKIRHELIQLLARGDLAAAQLLDSRDSRMDVARPAASSNLPPAYSDTLDLYQANFRRVEEGFRSLEEFLRLVEVATAREVEYLRYRVYDLQKDLMPKALAASHRSKMDFELYVVTDRSLSGGRSHEEVARAAIRGGAGCIQYREKTAPTREFLEQARLLRKVTREEGATFIVNDRLEVALEVGADGIHLGQDDLPLEVARRLTKGGLLIGISTHSVEEALEAQTGGAGYINIGPLFPTDTKQNPMAPVTPELVRMLAPQLRIPFTTMGGIHLENVAQAILAGADRVAVVSEVVSAENIEAAASRMVEAIRRAKEERGAKGA
jgi:thiamine-phosphate pyrophosphorylase